MSTMIPVPTSGTASADHREDPETPVRRNEEGAPEQFIWEGQLYTVRTVLGHSVTGDVEEWRVRAATGRHAVPEVFILRFDRAKDRWTVVPEGPETADRLLPRPHPAQLVGVPA
jgi:hypothetical protein